MVLARLLASQQLHGDTIILSLKNCRLPLFICTCVHHDGTELPTYVLFIRSILAVLYFIFGAWSGLGYITSLYIFQSHGKFEQLPEKSKSKVCIVYYSKLE